MNDLFRRCSTCKGSGRVSGIPPEPAARYAITRDTFRCDACGGEGYVIAPPIPMGEYRIVSVDDLELIIKAVGFSGDRVLISALNRIRALIGTGAS